MALPFPPEPIRRTRRARRFWLGLEIVCVIFMAQLLGSGFVRGRTKRLYR